MTTRTITGPIYEPNGDPVATADIRFRAISNNYSASNPVAKGTETTVTTSAAGALSVALGLGDYRVELKENGEATWSHMGDIAVEAGASIVLGQLISLTDDTADLNAANWVTYTEMVAYVDAGAGSPGDLDITDLGLGTATARQNIRINKGETAIIGELNLGVSMTFGRL